MLLKTYMLSYYLGMMVGGMVTGGLVPCLVFAMKKRTGVGILTLVACGVFALINSLFSIIIGVIMLLISIFYKNNGCPPMPAGSEGNPLRDLLTKVAAAMFAVAFFGEIVNMISRLRSSYSSSDVLSLSTFLVLAALMLCSVGSFFFLYRRSYLLFIAAYGIRLVLGVIGVVNNLSFRAEYNYASSALSVIYDIILILCYALLIALPVMLAVRRTKTAVHLSFCVIGKYLAIAAIAAAAVIMLYGLYSVVSNVIMYGASLYILYTFCTLMRVAGMAALTVVYFLTMTSYTRPEQKEH